jgi:hypothetical protein
MEVTHGEKGRESGGRKGMWMDSERRRKKEKERERGGLRGSAWEILCHYLAGQKGRVFNDRNLSGWR